MSGSQFDIAIIGGGINGCGIARDAAGRGLSVFLCDKGDLAGATSSASTKLIHGGLRYLELYEFRLVREALIEREVLLRSAPHIISPLRFILPHHRGLRPWPVIRLGLFLYDHLGGRRLLPPTRSVDLDSDPAGRGLKKTYRRAFEYSDCWVEDSRLVVLNARDAADRGAEIRTRTKCVEARRTGATWHLTMEDQRDYRRFTIEARALVNAGGPWASEVITAIAGLNAPAPVRLVKGSHIVVDRLFDHDRAYIFQNSDGRVCFAIPFEHDFTLIGTTDEDFEGDPAAAAATEAEKDYLLASVGEYLDRPLTRDMIRWTYAGVRPLYDDGASKAQEATRDYVLSLDTVGRKSTASVGNRRKDHDLPPPRRAGPERTRRHVSADARSVDRVGLAAGRRRAGDGVFGMDRRRGSPPPYPRPPPHRAPLPGLRLADQRRPRRRVRTFTPRPGLRRGLERARSRLPRRQ